MCFGIWERWPFKWRLLSRYPTQAVLIQQGVPFVKLLAALHQHEPSVNVAQVESVEFKESTFAHIVEVDVA